MIRNTYIDCHFKSFWLKTILYYEHKNIFDLLTTVWHKNVIRSKFLVNHAFFQTVGVNLHPLVPGVRRWRAYKGETGRNAYSRGIEHLDYLEANDEDKSVLWLHSIHHHQSRRDVKYSMKVTGAFQDPLDRQIIEKVQIHNFKGKVLVIRRSEMGGVQVERMQYRRWGGGN